jgi:hypothetical protein
MMRRSTRHAVSIKYSARKVVDGIAHRASLIGGKFVVGVANDLEARTHRINASD